MFSSPWLLWIMKKKQEVENLVWLSVKPKIKTTMRLLTEVKLQSKTLQHVLYTVQCTLYNVQCTYSYIVYIKLTSTVIKLPSNLNPKICNYWLSNKRAGLHGFLFPFHAYLSQQENYIYSALFYLFYDREDCEHYYFLKIITVSSIII